MRQHPCPPLPLPFGVRGGVRDGNLEEGCKATFPFGVRVRRRRGEYFFIK